ncbi:superoxide dismutase family protein [Corynebacterium glyciniphilum]|uniref:superoxide dismutase family protein n=1 Tax=Corynebacterium glyciniphilum TaxID=1404244 RepID=UPI002656B5A4|nr:superoxide dismutase family protein [Corynebacterium glyciniphilum]MDN5684314.1 superoxide dismutase family protein [Corynebacterium glyciniphilum]MDN6706505.1 superoxide dismutase family protein [Corynebacterium glyciniphilum]
MFTINSASPAADATTPPARAGKHRRSVIALGAASLLVLSACSTDSDDDSSTDAAAATGTGTSETAGSGGADGTGAIATAAVENADGDEVGTVEISAPGGDDEGTSELSVSFSGLEPGMYGMHVHAVGVCEPDSTAPDDDSDNPETGDFLSAGGHMGADGHDHPDHGGDLPALLVNENGEGRMTVTTDRIEDSDLLDDDGSAIIVHEDPDNYSNIPERYAPDGPDEDTLSTGDAGGRQACGVFEAA